MTKKRKRILLVEATACSLAFMFFAFFVQYAFPVRLIALGSLIIPAYFFSSNLRSAGDLKKVTGGWTTGSHTLFYVLTGAVLGVILALIYRWYLGIPFLPTSIFLFAAVAALIGSMEELVFRGFIQEYVRNSGALLSILFSALAHTGYKCCLFLSPAVAVQTDIGILAFWTFIVGIVLSFLKHFSRTIWPPLVAHAIFDILVYAEYVQAPWWVW